ncbi:MAG: YdbL family protein [Xanthomonadales bacterium]|nr:YdbL family protein [Xanthomonadales bacterium]
MKLNKWTTKVFLALLIGLLSISAVQASALSEAKASGLIGEQPNGYLGLVQQNAPGNVKALIADVNAKRKAVYQRIADRQGTSLKGVERVGGQSAIEKTLQGNYIRSPGGSWQKK